MAKAKGKRRPRTPPQVTYPKVYESFNDPTMFGFHRQHEPSAFNGIVKIERYRVTVEIIPESRQDLLDRLLKLWRESESNVHHREPMRRKAVELGLTEAEARAILDINEQGIDYKESR